MKSSILCDLPTSIGVANFRITTGHDYLIKHLYRFGLADAPACLLYHATDLCEDHLVSFSRLGDIAVALVKKHCRLHCVSELYLAAHHRLLPVSHH
ncbi:hypothetical protein TNCV_4003681 [Trichonephila clavipes]|nr:hypothetical protein TNCV_4003681 [Trichonephila clavipes]